MLCLLSVLKHKAMVKIDFKCTMKHGTYQWWLLHQWAMHERLVMIVGHKLFSVWQLHRWSVSICRLACKIDSLELQALVITILDGHQCTELPDCRGHSRTRMYSDAEMSRWPDVLACLLFNVMSWHDNGVTTIRQETWALCTGRLQIKPHRNDDRFITLSPIRTIAKIARLWGQYLA